MSVGVGLNTGLPRLLKAKQDIYYLSVQNRIEEYVSMLDNYSIVLSNRVDSYNNTQYKQRDIKKEREKELSPSLTPV